MWPFPCPRRIWIARRFYAEKLGLEPADERPGVLSYRVASDELSLQLDRGSAGAGPVSCYRNLERNVGLDCDAGVGLAWLEAG